MLKQNSDTHLRWKFNDDLTTHTAAVTTSCSSGLNWISAYYLQHVLVADFDYGWYDQGDEM
jgi:hypothetical protein